MGPMLVVCLTSVVSSHKTTGWVGRRPINPFEENESQELKWLLHRGRDQSHLSEFRAHLVPSAASDLRLGLPSPPISLGRHLENQLQ